MITILGNPSGAPMQWCDLADELDRWGEKGRTATLWWRDDDAAAPSRCLTELLTIAQETPLALAVVPAHADPALAECLSPTSSTKILQHGWRHANRATAGKKSEFPLSRGRDAIAADLGAGRERLASMFGNRTLAVLAPPWNRFDAALLPLLGETGIPAISRMGPRATAWPTPGVFEANVHVDLVAWRSGRGFVGETAALTALLRHLAARRTSEADPDEPTGILTHHLVQDGATRDFLYRLLASTRSHSAARWLDAGEVFAPGLAAAITTGRA